MSCFIISLMFISTSLLAQDLKSLLPDSAGIWKKDGSEVIYTGNELYRLIDGGADIFNEYGFNRVIVQRYINKYENSIDIEIYEMNDSSSAYGIFSLFTLNAGEKIIFGCDAYAGEGFMLLWKGNYYISLSWHNVAGEKEELLLLAKMVEMKIISSPEPALVAAFNEPGNIKTTYIKGNLGLYNISRFNFGREFKLEEGVYFTTGTAQKFIFRYNNESECKKNYAISFESFKNNPEYKLQQSETDINLFKGEEYFIKQLRINNYLIFVLSNNIADAEKISEEIKNNLIH